MTTTRRRAPARRVPGFLVVAALSLAAAATTSSGPAPHVPVTALPALPEVSSSAAADAVPSLSPNAAPTASPGASLNTSPTPSPGTSAAASPTATPGTGATASSDERCAADTLARLTPSERAGQVLMLGVPVNAAGSASSSVRRYRPGGVFLRGRSSRSTTEVARQIRVLQQTRSGTGTAYVRLHVAVDQEGGQVQTLSGPGLSRLPSALEQGRWDEATLTARTARWATVLHGIGVTMDLAPVADTVPADGRRNPPIGAARRQYGAQPDGVATDVATVTRALEGAGVVATLKHFPGLGRVRVNTDLSDDATDPVATEHDPHLRPFAAGVAAGAGAVMMSSASYPRLDADRPAMFSPRIVGMLRTDLGFTGLVISDDLGAARAVAGVPVGRRAVTFVAAGGDMVLTVRTADAGPMRTALVQAAAASPAFRRRLDDAALHVLLSKQRAGLLRCTA